MLGFNSAFRYEVWCRSGCLTWGYNEDFLCLVQRAKSVKQRLTVELPLSVLRVKLYDPRNGRIPTGDIKAALRALADKGVSSMVSCRSQVIQPAVVPGAARSDVQARVGLSSFLTLPVGSVFCQAGVVAPPDSPDLGNLPVVAMAGASLGV
jgi:hypothetical protein